MDELRRLPIFLAFCLAQVLIFSRVHLLGCSTPYVMLFFLLLFPLGYPQWRLMLWSFAMGLIIDMFNNTPGVSSASLTLIAAIQAPLLKLLSPRDSDDNTLPSTKDLGWGNFTVYATIITAIFCFVYTLLELFSFFDFLYFIACVVGSTLFTLLFHMTLERFRVKE
jgi:rod shape-determining protein MreD